MHVLFIDKNLKMFSVDLKEVIAQSSLSDLVGDVWDSLRLEWVGHAGGGHKWYHPFTYLLCSLCRVWQFYLTQKRCWWDVGTIICKWLMIIVT